MVPAEVNIHNTIWMPHIAGLFQPSLLCTIETGSKGEKGFGREGGEEEREGRRGGRGGGEGGERLLTFNLTCPEPPSTIPVRGRRKAIHTHSIAGIRLSQC